MAGTSPAMTQLKLIADGASALHAHRNAHAAADAERGKAFLGIALAHLVQQGDEHPRPGRADRMSERDRAAVDVDLGGIPTKVFVHRARLRRKGLVRLDQTEI